jgi:purine-binding chemotaxis protein CheW
MRKSERFDWAGVLERLKTAQQMPPPTEMEAARTAILEQRAKLLAIPPGESSAETGEMVMTFRAGQSRFALPLRDLVQVLRQPRVALVPGAPSEVAGLIQVRGEVRPVYDLHTLVGIARDSASKNAFVLLLRNADGEFGILVDEVDEIRTVPVTERKQATKKRGYAGWMTGDLIPVLSSASLLRGED